MDNIKFGKFIKELRQKQNMTQKQLAEKINLTDKAISKWERGLSFPDITMLNSLSDVFGVSISEIVNGEYGKQGKVDIEKEIQEAIEKVTLKNEKKAKKRKRIKKTIGIIFAIIFALITILQLGYILVLKKYGFEYVIDILSYIFNELIIISGSLVLILLFKKNRVKSIVTYSILLIATIINLAYMFNDGFENNCIVQFSSDFSNQLVLKQNKKTGAVTIYKDTIILFARPKEKFTYEAKRLKTQWLTDDICSITYLDRDKKIREFVATYGDRSNGISYYNVKPAITGKWQVNSQYGSPMKIVVDSKGITIDNNGKIELFENADYKQYGTIALVLYDNQTPKYVIALDENCKIDEETNLIKQGGTITVCEVSMNKTKEESFYCIIHKSDDLSDYNVVSVSANSYCIDNGILYISYDGNNVIEVPGDFSQSQDLYNEYNYQISKEKTIFIRKDGSKRYLVFSNDMGKTWNTVEFDNDYSIQTMKFINSNFGYMLAFGDVAMGGIAYGDIRMTFDGGYNWEVVSLGIGNETFEDPLLGIRSGVFKASSQILFITENIGFLTMPSTMGEYCDLYITKDCGVSFSKVNIIQSEVYDYYKLPIVEDEKLYLRITQGSYSDYNGVPFLEYYSYDNGETWVQK